LLTEQLRILRRHREYMRHRMIVEISDPKYLWWDNVFAEHMEEAIERYLRLVFIHASGSRNGCLWYGTKPRSQLKFRGKTITGYRFAYAVATVIPLSQLDVIRHECNNPYCVNPRHLMVGDQKDNFLDFLAYEAYGTRFELLQRWDSWK